MKKAIPALIAILLIITIGGIYGYNLYKEKYAYSDEQYDTREYFGLGASDEIAVVMGDETADFKARLINGVCYFDIDTVRKVFNKRFYEDSAEGLLLYVEPAVINTVNIGKEKGYYAGDSFVSTEYTPAGYKDGTLYVACDYVRLFTNYEYEYFEEPSRMQVYTQWPAREIARINKDTWIRYRGGVKSPILRELAAGEEVYVLDTMDTWSQIRTADCYIGYVENKRLEDYETIDPIPVTDYKEPEFTHTLFQGKINMTWHNVAGEVGNDTIIPFLENTHGINVVSPTWFGLSDNSGNISDIGSASYVTTLHDRGISVWGLVSNFTDTSVDSYAVLSSTTARRNLITNLINASEAYGLDGINVDFEGLNVESGVHFVQFIRELSVECRRCGLILSVDNYVPIGNTDFYDRAEQGVYADYVVIMGYDEHYAGSEEAGSVASISYVEQGIKRTSEEVEASRIINGIPFFTRIWDTTGSEVTSQAVDMVTAQQFLADHNIVTEWDEECCQTYGEYTQGDTRRQIWLEDAESIEVKLNVMDAYGVAGVASWRLGMETPDIWDVIADYMNK